MEIQDEKSKNTILRYPGGKHYGRKFIIPYFPQNITEMISPFLGGGSIEVFMASNGVKVHAYDKFDLLVNYWKYQLQQPRKLAERIHRYFPMSRYKFFELRNNIYTIPNGLERAAVFFVLNICSFSGITLSGGFSNENTRERFNKEKTHSLMIEKIQNLNITNMTVECQDFITTLERHTTEFMYLDPPYMIKKDYLYGKMGNLHSNFDHYGLCERLKARNNWIMSYDNNDVIRKMYKNNRIQEVEWNNSFNKKGKKIELLIFSNDLT